MNPLLKASRKPRENLNFLKVDNGANISKRFWKWFSVGCFILEKSVEKGFKIGHLRAKLREKLNICIGLKIFEIQFSYGFESTP